MNKTTRLLIAATVAVALLAIPGGWTAAAAQQNGGGTIDPDHITSRNGWQPGPTTPQPGPGPRTGPRHHGGPSKPSYLRWSWKYDITGSFCITNGTDGLPRNPDWIYLADLSDHPTADFSHVIWHYNTPIPAGYTQDGELARALLVDTRDGNEVAEGEWVCRGGARPIDLPPPVPEPEEVAAAAPIPQIGFHISPDARGLTGLESYLWADGGHPELVQAPTPSIRGYVVTTTARLVGYSWDMGDGNEITSATPGTAAAPSVRYPYEQKGDHVITLSVVWDGSYTFTGPDVPSPVTVELGAVSNASSRPYHVIEVRAALDDASN